MKLFSVRSVFLFALLLQFGMLHAQHTKYDIQFLSGVYNAEIQPVSKALIPDQGEIVNGKYYRLIQFNRIPMQYEKEKMESFGLRFIEYIPNYTYLVSVPEKFDAGLLSTYAVRTAIRPVPAMKMPPALINGEIPVFAQRPGDRVALNVLFYDGVTISDGINTLMAEGFETGNTIEWAGIAQVEIPLSELIRLAALPVVYFIEVVAEPDQPENYSARTQHRSNNINSDHSLGRKFDGTGVNVMLQDDGMIGPHADYQGRVPQQFLTFNGGDHGDHCGGTIMSAGNIDPEGRGMAPGADLYVYTASGYDGFANISTHYGLYDIRVSSTSYSNGCNAGYTSLAQELDEQIHTYDHLIHVFSAGNNGTSDCGYGAGNGWGNVTGGHKIGKNVVAVANLNYLDVVATSSSRGPAHDGRIKPELAAKGTSVWSTVDPHSYAFKTGTSMACPGVAGVFAQLFHAYRDNSTGMDPEGGLVKAIAMNTAEDLGNPGPDFIYGFGRVNALRAVRTIENQWHLTDTIIQNQNKQHNIAVPANTAELRVMVYWTDFKGSVATNKALVNDMDMQVSYSTQTWNPWVLDHTANPANLNQPAVRAIDSLNNVEQVTIDNPAAGNYTITINGKLIPQGPQKYYVVWYFVEDAVELTYPNGGDKMVPGEVEAIRWDAPEGTAPFTLEYSTNGGANWTVVSNAIGATVRSHPWSVPNNVTGNAWFKVSRGSDVDSSDHAFSIIGLPSNISIDYSCPDSIGVSWSSVSGADGYVLYALGSKYMDSTNVSLTTSGAITGVDPMAETWLSVSAMNSTSGAMGRRAVAIYKQPGVWNCASLDDAELLDIISPGYEKIYDCQNLDSVPIVVTIMNNSAHPIGPVPVKASVDNGPVNSFTFTGTIPANSSAQLNASGGIDLNGPGMKEIKIWTDLPSDGFRANDTMTSIVEVIQGGIVSLPWVENFDSLTNCGTDPDCSDQECTLGRGMINQKNYDADDIDWIIHYGSTYSSNTGPSTDHTTGSFVGRYVYTESSGGCNGMEAQMITPCIDLLNAQLPVLEFWYHMYGADMGALHVDIMVDGGWINDIITPLSGNQGNTWRSAQVDLTAYIGEYINLRFRGITGSGYMSDLALDDIQVVETVGLDDDPLLASLRVFPNPSSDIFNLINDGLNLDGAEISITDLTGRMVYSEYVDNLAPGAIVPIDVATLATGVYHLTVQTNTGSWHTSVMKD